VKINNKHFVLLFSLSFSLLTGCSRTGGSSPSNPVVTVTYDGITYNLQNSQVTADQSKLIQVINDGPNEAAMNAFIGLTTIGQHAKAAQKSIDQNTIVDFTKAVINAQNTNDPFELKQTIEDQLAKKFSPETLKYNKAMVSIGDIVGQNQMQCFSGTTLYSVLRLLSAAFIKTQLPSVIIFKPGHVLPGFLGSSPDGATHLYGIETTVSGKGEIDFGSIDKVPSNVVVIETRDVLVAGIFKTSLINIEELRKSIIEKTSNELNLKYQSDVFSLYKVINIAQMK
jgi:hypothetical protein